MKFPSEAFLSNFLMSEDSEGWMEKSVKVDCFKFSESYLEEFLWGKLRKVNKGR